MNNNESLPSAYSPFLRGSHIPCRALQKVTLIHSQKKKQPTKYRELESTIKIQDVGDWNSTQPTLMLYY